jgi:hypothetical protein
MAVHITIGELRLIGFDPRDRHTIAAAIERAVAAHLDVAALRRGDGAPRIDRIAAPDAAPNARGGAAVGAAVGRSVAGAVNGGER